MSATDQLGATMAMEMAEQPMALRRLLGRRSEIEEGLRSDVPSVPVGIVLLARGTSDNAGVFGRYILEMALGVSASMAAPSLWTRYRQHANLGGHLLVALSQSGRTPEIEDVLRSARADGANVIAITNEAGSPLAEASGSVVTLDVGIELAVPATKTFTGQLAGLAIVAGALARHDVPGLAEMDAIPALQEQVLEDIETAHSRAERLAEARAAVVIGSGYLYAVALEAALKLQETTGMPVLAFSASDFMHGPLAVAGPEVPVVCFAADGPVLKDVAVAAEAAAARGAPVIWTSDSAGPDVAWDRLPVAPGAPEPLAGLVHAVRAQQLALETSRILGRNADAPQGLQKVTLTR
jgi:glucosamine--fructose-6-phosphate aminotransferase (isomerizing)